MRLAEIQPGMRLAKDVHDPHGQILIRAGVVLGERQIRALRSWGVVEVGIVQDEDTADPAVRDPKAIDEIRRSGVRDLDRRLRHRLLVAEVDQELPGERAQAGSRVREGSERGSGRARCRCFDPRFGAESGLSGRGRGDRKRRAVCTPARSGVRHRSGIPSRASGRCTGVSAAVSVRGSELKSCVMPMIRLLMWPRTPMVTGGHRMRLRTA
jgi:hypothetical protein